MFQGGKMKNNKKRFDIIFLVSVFMLILSIIVINPINSLDEIWNFNNAKNISDGLVPYRDFNVVGCPLISIICSMFLKFIAKELIIMRFLEAILMTLIIYLSYKILDKIIGKSVVHEHVLLKRVFLSQKFFFTGNVHEHENPKKSLCD